MRNDPDPQAGSKIINKNIKKLWKINFESAKGAYDIYVLFIEQGLKLLKDKGILGYITPNKYLSSPYGLALRNYISENYTLKEIVDISGQSVFEDPSVYPIITFITNELINERRRNMYKSPKIIVAKIALRLEGFLDDKGEYSSINTNCIYSPN
ncbi:unnamed protein product, partial [marine sediment metagenome]